jgi:hypothetical protein
MGDPLYFIFEQSLFNALVEDETTDEFLVRVVTAYMGQLRSGGTIIPASHVATMEADLREEVLEMFRKKTYGHFNLASYRRAHGVETAAPSPPLDLVSSAAQNEKARRGGRAS